jgi:hypothetical protein
MAYPAATIHNNPSSVLFECNPSTPQKVSQSLMNICSLEHTAVPGLAHDELAQVAWPRIEQGSRGRSGDGGVFVAHDQQACAAHLADGLTH